MTPTDTRRMPRMPGAMTPDLDYVEQRKLEGRLDDARSRYDDAVRAAVTAADAGDVDRAAWSRAAFAAEDLIDAEQNLGAWRRRRDPDGMIVDPSAGDDELTEFERDAQDYYVARAAIRDRRYDVRHDDDVVLEAVTGTVVAYLLEAAGCAELIESVVRQIARLRPGRETLFADARSTPIYVRRKGARR